MTINIQLFVYTFHLNACAGNFTPGTDFLEA